MATLTSRLGLAIAAIVLVYFVIYAIACPTKELVSAVAFEVCAFAVVIFFRLRKTGKASERAREAILDELVHDFKLARRGRKIWRLAVNAVLVLTIGFLTLDLTALLCTAAELYPVARVLYLANPIYRLPEVHPALSAELLGGAFMEANHLERAERLSVFLLDIREAIFGKKHQMVAEMYGNFARVYLKKGEPKIAEEYSRRSIVMWKECAGVHKLGSAYTKLGNALRDQKRYPEAIQAYEEALAMREREFGTKSEKVLETLTDFHECLIRSGDSTRAAKMLIRIKDVEAYQAAHAPEKNLLLPICLVGSLIVSYFLFGPKGVLTRKAIDQLKKRVDTAGKDAKRADIERLIVIYKQRKDTDMVEQYEMLLRS